MRPGPGGGLEALPMPRGEPSGLWAAAAVLRAAAAAATGAPLASRRRAGAGARRLVGRGGDGGDGPSWSSVAARETAMADRLTRAAAVLCGYADELDAAQRSMATLQALVGREPAGRPAGAAARDGAAAVAATYGVVVGRPPARRRRRGAPAARAGRRGRRRGPSGTAARRDALGWADPPPTDAAVRAAVLAGLPVVSGVAAQRGGSRPWPTWSLADLAAVADGDGGAAARAAGRLGRPRPRPGRGPGPVGAARPRAGRSAGRRPDRVTRRSCLGGGAAPPRCRAGRRRRTRSTPPRPTRPRGPGWTRGASPGWPRGPRGSVRCAGSGEGRAVAATWVQGVLLTAAARGPG